MSDNRRFREIISEPFDAEQFGERLAKGWRPLLIEWERPDAAGATGLVGASLTGSGVLTEVPYGLRVAEDGYHLEECEEEIVTMRRMLQLIVDDTALWKVAETVNAEGPRQRDGREWSQTVIFSLLPRLVEVAPTIFGSEDWAQWRRSRPRRVSA